MHESHMYNTNIKWTNKHTHNKSYKYKHINEDNANTYIAHTKPYTMHTHIKTQINRNTYTYTNYNIYIYNTHTNNNNITHQQNTTQYNNIYYNPYISLK